MKGMEKTPKQRSGRHKSRQNCSACRTAGSQRCRWKRSPAWRCRSSTTRRSAGSARRLPWGSYGMLCRASLGSPDLGVAIKRWCRHHRLLTDDITLDLSRDRRGRRPCRSPSSAIWARFREFCLVSSLRFLHRLRLLGDRLADRPRAPPPFRSTPRRIADVYPLMFGGEPALRRQRTSYSFDARYLALPLQRDERRCGPCSSARCR